ncbi:MAG: ribosome biogenesis GTP-binding protein YihA/YsxC [Clostridia bacterium]|nr:ribosome biogenesis GTP-binding protein YihA/YsxC [Clostridia bacterium]
MVVKNPKFLISCANPSQYPDLGVPEIAFAGRSNVGKSSLINALLNRKSLARSGSRQGMTRLVNFFNIDDVLLFVDLPGYGYAAVSKEERRSWGRIVEDYLNKSRNLHLIILLVDIRHKPTQDDIQMMTWIRANNVNHIIAATKADKIGKTQYHKNINIIRQTLNTDCEIIPVSNLKKTGIDRLWEAIDKYIPL